MISNRLTIVLTSLFLLLPLWANAGEVGYVNIDHVFLQSNEGRKLNKEFDVYHKNLADQLTAKENDFQSQVAAFRQQVQRGELTPVQQQEAEKALRLEEQSMKNSRSQAEQSLQSKRGEIVTTLFSKVSEITKTLAQERGFSMVFNQQQNLLIYAEPGADLTDTVIRKLNSRQQ